MTDSESDCLHIWLITEAESKAQLFTDLCAMARHLVERFGGTLQEVPDPIAVTPRSHHYFAQVRGVDAARRLSHEMGIHRAQVVPASSTNGRVETALVGLESIASAGAARTSRPEGPVLRTYNYIHRTVTHHASGEQLALESVLRGEA
jgi:protein subunit release factor A